MNQVLQFPVRVPVVILKREDTIRDMANHLIAGITNGLDLSNDFDVIRYLKNTEDAYPAKVITAHMDAAVHEARQIVIAAVFGGAV